MVNRFILFLLFLGAATLVMFILSVADGEPDISVLIASAGCLGLAILIRLIFPAREPSPSSRFRLFRSRRGSERDDDLGEGTGSS